MLPRQRCRAGARTQLLPDIELRVKPDPLTLTFYLGFGTIIIAAFVLATMSFSGIRPTTAPSVWLGFGCVTVIMTGLLALAAAKMTVSHLQFSLSILIGAIITAFILAVVCLGMDIRAGTALLAWGILISMIFAVAWKRGFISMPPIDPWDVASVLTIAIATTAWCHMAASALRLMNERLVVPVWTDYFIHGTELAQFGGAIGAGRHSFLLIDQPFVLYHYASFMLPAAVLQIFDLTGFAAATSVMLPLGLLLAALSCYVLGTSLGGRLAGVAAVAAVILLPNPSTYWIHNGFFGFDWMVFTAPGSGYGIAVCATILAIFGSHLNAVPHRGLALITILIVTIFQFRVQLFFLLIPAIVLTFIWRTNPVRPYRRLIATSLAAVLTAVTLMALFVPPVNRVWLGFSAVRPFIELTASTQETAIYAWTLANEPSYWAMAVGFFLLVPAILGWFLLLYPLALAVSWRRLRLFDFFPVWCLFVYLLIVLVAPVSPVGAIGDWQQRSFILVYITFVCWSVGLLVRNINSQSARRVAWVLMLPISVVGVARLWREEPAKPAFAWGAAFYNLPITRDILITASYLREHSVVGDVVAFNPMNRTASLVDTPTELGALSNVPFYIARPAIHMIHGWARRAVAVDRLAKLAHAAQMKDFVELEAELRANGITWYVWDQTAPAFDPDRTRASFTSGTISVYRIN
jgi:hypothetical protein